MHDIGRETGLSVSTVSRALDDSELVSKTAKVKVGEAAARLGYLRRTVKRPQSRSIKTIRLFIPASKDPYVHMFYNVASLIVGIRKGFGDGHLNIIISVNDGTEASFTAKKATPIDGAIFAFTEANDRVYAKYESLNIPMIHINRIRHDRNYIAVDNYLGMETLLRKVCEHRTKIKPCYIGFSPISYISEERRVGLLGSASKMGLLFGRDDCFTFETIREIDERLVAKLVALGYNAFFCFNDLIAVHVFNRALRDGFEIPRDFSLTGFDNSPILDLAAKRIDTIDFPIFDLGNYAGSWMKQRLIDRSKDAMRITLAGNYICGETIALEHGAAGL